MSRVGLRLLASIVLFVGTAGIPSVSSGQWSFIPPPTVGPKGDVFNAVDGSSANDIWAVGAWGPPDWNYRCLIEHFDGVSWTRLPVPEVGSSEALRGVLAVSGDQAIAVGRYISFTRAVPIAMEWNGNEWVQVAVPAFAGSRTFTAVDQTPGGEIWVAGYQAGSGFITQKTEGGWIFEIAPPAENLMNRFHGMHAAADNQIWVVGSYEDGSGTFRILIRRYDGGSSWTTFGVPTPGLSDRLWAIHAFAPNDVWAVGEYYHAQRSSTQPLIMHYDGADWTHIELPDYPEGPAHLRAIAARSPGDIYAAGTYGLGTSPALPRPLVLHYDGVTWSDVSLPSTGGVAEWFMGMTAAPSGDIWAVGQYSDGLSMEPMAFRNEATVTAIGEVRQGRPLLRSVPNPFRSGTTVHFNLGRPDPVCLRVMDLSGRLVRVLVDENLGEGLHVVPWDGNDVRGQPVPAGVYFYDLDVGGRIERGKVVRIR